MKKKNVLQEKQSHSTRKETTYRHYRELRQFDKIFDIVLLLSILVGITLFLIELLSSPSAQFHRLVLWFDIYFVGLMLTDLTRGFLYSRNFLHFTRHYWLDMVLLALAIISLSSFLYLGAGRLSWLLREEKIAVLFREERSFEAIWKLGFFRKIFR